MKVKIAVRTVVLLIVSVFSLELAGGKSPIPDPDIPQPGVLCADLHYTNCSKYFSNSPCPGECYVTVEIDPATWIPRFVWDCSGEQKVVYHNIKIPEKIAGEKYAEVVRSDTNVECGVAYTCICEVVGADRNCKKDGGDKRDLKRSAFEPDFELDDIFCETYPQDDDGDGVHNDEDNFPHDPDRH